MDALPGPAALEFECEAPAEERPDRNDQPQHEDAVHRRREGDRAHDVGGHEYLEAEQDRAAEILPIALESRRTVEVARQPVSSARDHQAANDQRHACDLGRRAGTFDEFPDLHGYALPGSRRRAASSSAAASATPIATTAVVQPKRSKTWPTTADPTRPPRK